MNKLIPVLIFCIVVSCIDQVNFNPGKIVSETREVENFREIEVGNNFHITMISGEEESLVIEAPQNHLPYIKSSVIYNRLIIEVDPALKRSKMGSKRIYLTVISLHKIILSGSTTLVSMDALTDDAVKLNLSGASKASLHLEASKTEVKASGASEITLQGNTAHLILQQISGGSIFRGFNFPAHEVEIFSTGGSKVFVSPENQLKVDASGGSEIHYKGNPIIVSNLSGGAKVVHSQGN